MKQQERQERSKNLILQAAFSEFGASDLDAVTMDGICAKHGISKGMMYHYYANKDELFLACVQQTFQELQRYVEQQAEKLAGQAPEERIKTFFLLREYYFEEHPEQKNIFENAMLRTPKHLEYEIWGLRLPLQGLNQLFLQQAVADIPLRPSLEKSEVTHYLGHAEYAFRAILGQLRKEGQVTDLHSMLEATSKIWDMVLFGVALQPENEASGTPAVSSGIV